MNALKKLRDKVTVVRLDPDSSDEDEDMPTSGLSLGRLLSIRAWTFSTLRYFVFVVLFVIVVFGSRPGEAGFFMSDQLKDLLLEEEFPSSTTHIRKTFWDVATFEEVFEYLEGPFLAGLYPVTDYDGSPVREDLQRALYGYDQIVGLVRIRQVRIRKNTCSVADKFKRVIRDCYDSWASSREDKTPFGPGNMFVWRQDEQSLFGGANGRLHLYPDDGFVVDLAKDRGNATAQLMALKNNHFLDLQSRLLAAEFSVYNANLNLFSVIRIAFEFPASGGAVPFAQFRTVKLLRYLSSTDYFVLVCEILLGCLVFLYIYEEIMEIVNACCRFKTSPGDDEHRGWRAYVLDDLWNAVDVLNLSLFLVVIIFRVIMTISLNQIFDTGNFKSDASYLNLQGIALMATQEININACNMLLVTIKTLKYLNHMDRIQQLSQTLVRAAADTALFLIMFLIIFFGYALAGFMMFSADVKGFRTIFRSMETLVLSILGSFDYSEIEQSNRYLAPMFFFSYMLLVFFVLLNMFIAIINNAYDSVRESAARRDAELRVQQLLSGKVQRLTPWAQIKRGLLIMKEAMLVKRYKKRSALIEKIRSGKGDVNLDGMITRAEAVAGLNLDETELDEFDRYDANDDDQLDADEIAGWLADLKVEKEHLEEALSDFMLLEEGLAESGKKLSREQIEHREEISKRLEDYKKRVARMGDAVLPELRQLEIRKDQTGMAPHLDPAILRLASTADPAAVTAAIADSHNQLMHALNTLTSSLKVMNNRLKRLEDASRTAAKDSIRSSANIGSYSSHLAAGVGTPSSRRPSSGFDIPNLASSPHTSTHHSPPVPSTASSSSSQRHHHSGHHRRPHS